MERSCQHLRTCLLCDYTLTDRQSQSMNERVPRCSPFIIFQEFLTTNSFLILCLQFFWSPLCIQSCMMWWLHAFCFFSPSVFFSKNGKKTSSLRSCLVRRGDVCEKYRYQNTRDFGSLRSPRPSPLLFFSSVSVLSLWPPLLSTITEVVKWKWGQVDREAFHSFSSSFFSSISTLYSPPAYMCRSWPSPLVLLFDSLPSSLCWLCHWRKKKLVHLSPFWKCEVLPTLSFIPLAGRQEQHSPVCIPHLILFSSL